jgi:hypothetical protein
MAAKKPGSKKTAPRKKPEKKSERKPEKKTVECEADRFVADLVIRGEAVRPGGGGLPSGATHEIVEESGGKSARVRRRRFSMT